jgi:Tfp pilus assembly protein PilV
MHREAGFSLVEATVAAVVLAVGVLGVAGSGTAAHRLADLGRTTSLAAETGASQLALLAANPCGATSGGASRGRLAVAWNVTAAAPLRMVDLRVQSPGPRGPRNVRFAATLLCPAELP